MRQTRGPALGGRGLYKMTSGAVAAFSLLARDLNGQESAPAERTPKISRLATISARL